MYIHSMGNGHEILVSELQKQNQFLQIVNQKAEEILLQAEQKLVQSEEIIIQTKQQLLQSEEKVKYLQFQLDQLKRMLFGARRERFVSNADVNQMTLPYTTPQCSDNKCSELRYFHAAICVG